MSTVLAFDFGAARIGVAVGTTELGIPHPVETIAAIDNDTRFARIATLIAEWQPAQLVVGLPLAEDGGEQESSRLARKFAQRLEGRFQLPVALVDERYSSAEASQALNQTGLKGRKQKPALDQVAAMNILDSWLAGAG
ncbi:putative holliday junction resolvase [Andreprevotia lacus DSM 23236]|uniref:Putative pre-16S rRNA nuclease n=1 Tax=Andreprevotia lacus DSM 23236 TaxID=1121001 RepID=A0A1W1X3S6_9NEIS|nr:Holliday junction resolvase RuvX [Andreprevotia lacus]SMC18378.1 putative holliday junction resolvase [Andreprevotia lacus DSM 23236]